MVSNYVIAMGLKKAVDKFEEPQDDYYLKLSEQVYLLDKKRSIMRKPAKLTLLAADHRLIFHCIGSLNVHASTSSNCCTGGIVNALKINKLPSSNIRQSHSFWSIN